jgi:hypothetical protein
MNMQEYFLGPAIVPLPEITVVPWLGIILMERVPLEK